MEKKYLIFPIIFCVGAIAIPLYKMLSVCNGEEELYKLEIKGRLVNKYLTRQTFTNLIFYNGKDTIEPSYTTYSHDLERNIEIGDSLYKASYDDSCTIFKKNIYAGYDSCLNCGKGNYYWTHKVIYGDSECPCDKRKKIRDEINAHK